MKQSSVIKKIKPAKKEREQAKELLDDVKEKLEPQLGGAEFFVGGSYAKNTWLKGKHDFDIFIRYSDDKNISKKLGGALNKVFKKVRVVHGSRDYYRVKHEDYKLEFVPVLKIESAEEAKNIMDVSPLHVEYVKQHLKKHDQVRLLKKFFRAQYLYGAESWIRGYSGYVCELLIIKHGTFKKTLKALSNKKPKIFVDVSKTYSGLEQAMQEMSKPKTRSPLILVDPVQPDRNAAASLTTQNLARTALKAKKYLKKPSKTFFEEKKRSKKRIRQRSKKKGTEIVFKDLKTGDNEEVFLAKARSKVKRIVRVLKREGFQPVSWGLTKRFAWFETPVIKTSPYKKHYGPPVWVEEEHLFKFLEKWDYCWVEGDKVVTLAKREYEGFKDLVNKLWQENG